ncbi:MAG: type II toxin-antitoxin system PemK/MazF family toxin [Alphaproteobacteria bacterium]
MSPRAYHNRTPFVVVCPITSKVKGHPFEVALPPGLAVGGLMLTDQVKNLDRRVGQLDPAGSVPEAVLQQVLANPAPLLSLRL